MRKLKKLLVTRVALVDQGSNPDADIVLFKRDEPVEKATFSEVLDQVQFSEVVEQICELTHYLEMAVASSLWSSGDRAGEILKSVSQFQDTVKSALTSWLEGKPVEIEDRAAQDDELKLRIARLREEVFGSIPKEEEDMPIDVSKLSAEEKVELRKALADEETKPSEEEVLKSLPEPILEMIRVGKQREDEAVAKAKAAEDALAVERKQREDAELTTELEKELPNLPGSIDERLRLFKQAKSDPALMSVLKQANQKISNVLDEQGDRGDVAPGTALERLQERARDLVSKGEAKTIEKAITVVAQRDPKLYNEYIKEQGRLH